MTVYKPVVLAGQQYGDAVLHFSDVAMLTAFILDRHGTPEIMIFDMKLRVADVASLMQWLGSQVRRKLQAARAALKQMRGGHPCEWQLQQPGPVSSTAVPCTPTKAQQMSSSNVGMPQPAMCKQDAVTKASQQPKGMQTTSSPASCSKAAVTSSDGKVANHLASAAMPQSPVDTSVEPSAHAACESVLHTAEHSLDAALLAGRITNLQTAVHAAVKALGSAGPSEQRLLQVSLCFRWSATDCLHESPPKQSS